MGVESLWDGRSFFELFDFAVTGKVTAIEAADGTGFSIAGWIGIGGAVVLPLVGLSASVRSAQRRDSSSARGRASGKLAIPTNTEESAADERYPLDG